jgi:hypothetical protein
MAVLQASAVLQLLQLLTGHAVLMKHHAPPTLQVRLMLLLMMIYTVAVVVLAVAVALLAAVAGGSCSGDRGTSGIVEQECCLC